jgi:arginine decarboxylase
LDVPVLRMLEALRARAWLHMPGHGGELPWLDGALDVTEIEASDDLMNPATGGAFDRAQRLAARAAGAGGTLFLTGGASLGMLAMLTCFVPPGGKVILPRDAHKSAIAACAVGDLRPVYVWPRVVEHKALLREQDVLDTLLEHPDAAAVLITRPDYCGVCVDLAPIARAARELGVAVLVDEAHGAHLPYGGTIASAGALGADAWVQSAHKTLPALTQAAYLHVRDAARVGALRERVALLGTSSPSFLVAASLDWARAIMQEYGKIYLENAMERNAAFLKNVQAYGITNAHAAWREMGYACDAARVCVDVRALGRSGYEVSRALAVQGIDVEMADCYRLVALPPIAFDGRSDALSALGHALSIMNTGAKPFSLPAMPTPRAEGAATPREAAFGRRASVRLEDARGRVVANAVGLYPPGVPMLMPGEMVGREAINALREAEARGAKLFGLEQDGRLSIMEE